MESSFKEFFHNIYQQSKELIKIYDSPSWGNLPANPLFSAIYLQRVLKFYMPTAPIWSNLLLGNFIQRYGYSSTSILPPCLCHFGRTTGVSESQMRVLKEAVLKHKIYSRIDEVISKVGDMIEAVEIQFADHALKQNSKNLILPAKKQKPAGEGWDRHMKTSDAGGYTSGKPHLNLISMMKTRLLGQNNDSSLGKQLKYGTLNTKKILIEKLRQKEKIMIYR